MFFFGFKWPPTILSLLPPPPTLTSKSKFMSLCHCGEPLGEKDKARSELGLGDFRRNTDSLLLAVHASLLEFVFWQ